MQPCLHFRRSKLRKSTIFRSRLTATKFVHLPCARGLTPLAVWDRRLGSHLWSAPTYILVLRGSMIDIRMGHINSPLLCFRRYLAGAVRGSSYLHPQTVPVRVHAISCHSQPRALGIVYVYGPALGLVVLPMLDLLTRLRLACLGVPTDSDDISITGKSSCFT
jgi:hypothetical protein